jgi:hypothetical protein
VLKYLLPTRILIAKEIQELSRYPMNTVFSASEGNKNLNQAHNEDVIVFELSNSSIGTKVFNLTNELNSRGIMFSFWISKKRKYLIIYRISQISLNKETLDNLLKHIISTYSLKIETKLDNFFIPKIKRIEQDGKILTLTHEDNSKQYVLACQLVSLDLETDTVFKRFTQFTNDLVEAEVFSINISQFASNERNQQNTPTLGVFFIARSHDKYTIKEKEAILLRYLKASTVKLNGQIIFLSKRDITKHKTNFQFFVPWIKHEVFINDLVNIVRLLPPIKIEVPKETSKIEQREKKDEIEKQVTIKNQDKKNVVSLPFPSAKKPFPSIRNKTIKKPEIIKAKDLPKEDIEKYAPSKIDDLSVPAPRTMNPVFDAEYLKVRISKIFKDFEFKESLIFEENFDLVLRKGSTYVFVKFFKDILTQNHAYQIIENLSSIAGLRNQFLCIAVADVVDEISKKLLSEYNVLHLTITDVLVSDKLKAKIYGTILA